MAGGGKKRKAAAAAAAAASAPVQPAARVDHQAERLTGKRAQKRGREGTVVYTYEVQWKDGPPAGKKWQNTFEPAECLVGWEAEMKKVDEQIVARSQQAFLKPVQVARAVKEQQAKEKAKALQQQRDQLLRKKRRQARVQASNGEEEQEESEDDDDDDDDDDDALLPDGEQLEHELLNATTQLEALQQLFRPAQTGTPTATPTEAATDASGSATKSGRKRPGTSRVWLAFDRETNLCCLPSVKDKTRKCGMPPKKGTGTSGHRGHLLSEHAEEWKHIQATGQVKTTVEMIAAAFAAKTDETKPAVGQEESAELNRLVALWITKCGRPQAIVEDAELRTLLARILELCKSRLRYELPNRKTVRNEISLLGHEGKALGRDFLVRLIKSGVKPSISGDLWSEGGMGLFGIFAHGITETWVMEKALIGLVACEKERHTAINITKWTDEALAAIGLSAEGLLAPATQ